MNLKVDKFFRSRFNIHDNYEAVRYRVNNRIEYDIDFLKKYIWPHSYVLDLGCGTGIIEERLENLVAGITAVDKFEEFILRSIPSPKIEYIVSDVVDFIIDKKFDVIILFGVTVYLSDSDCLKLYKNVSEMLDHKGVFIVKNQFGVKGKVVIDKYSEELHSNYYAVYRHLPSAVRTLEKYFNVQIIDIYPPELNRWDNTHEYALKCTLKTI